MKLKNVISMLVMLSLVTITGIAYGDNKLSYDETVSLIKETMVNGTSEARKESYDYIRFNECLMDYNVLGTYPSGGLYNLAFHNIDFSSLNYQASKVAVDYTSFIILNFNKYLQSTDAMKVLNIRTVVINVSDDEKAMILFEAFSNLGKLCGAPKGS